MIVATAGSLGCGKSETPAALTPPPTSSSDQSRLSDSSATYEGVRISAEQNPKSADLAVEAGTMAGNTGRYGEALRWFQRAAALKPDLLPALTGQGQMWMELGRPGMAAAAYEKALHLAPTEPLLLLETARAYTYVRDFGRALKFAQVAEKLSPDNSDVYRALSQISFQVMDVEGSLKAARRSCDLKPDDPEGWNNYGGLLLRNQRFTEAETALKKALALSPGNVTANLLYAHTLVDGRKTAAADAEAFAVMARVRSVDPHNADALLLQGQIQVRAGNLPLAVSLLSRAREETPRDSEVLLALGQALTRLRKAEQGIRLVNESQKLGPAGIAFMDLENTVRQNPNPVLVVRLAEMYRRKELYDSAVSLLERTLKKYPKNASLQQELTKVREQLERERPLQL